MAKASVVTIGRRKKATAARKKAAARPARSPVSALIVDRIAIPAGSVRIKATVDPAALIRRDLQQVVEILGLNQSARVLEVDRSQLSRCVKNAEGIGASLSSRITNLRFVLTRAFQVMHADEVGPWLTEPEPLLGGSIPLNVLAIDGPARVVEALDAIVSGAFA
jgi:uncharacterized protein (DUF2384 family)